MKLNVTDEHMTRMAAEAINSSKAVGMGWMHYDPNSNVTPRDIHIVDGRISIDYYQGRMVKFHARRVAENQWEVNENLSRDYQSWCVTYPTWNLLMEATTHY